MEITNQIEKYINSKNENIWNELKSYYTFQLDYNPLEYSWTCKIEGNKALIVTPNRKIEIDSFTHELLHIYLDYLGLSKYPDLISSIEGENSMGILVVESDLISHIYNFASHKKMFPLFKEIGFSEYNFVQERISFNENDLEIVRTGFLNGGKQSDFIHQFIGHSLALMNNVVEDDRPKCLKFLEQLQNLKPDLFQIIEDFDNTWDSCGHLNFIEVFLIFEKRLDEWLIENNLTFENDYCN